jgi:hypothetical protein
MSATFRELVVALPYMYPSTHVPLYPLSFLTPLFPHRLPVDHFVSVLCVSVLPVEELLKFRIKEVTLNYLAL